MNLMGEIIVERAGDGWFVAGVGRVSLRQVRMLAEESGRAIRWPADLARLVGDVEAADTALKAANRESVRSRLALAQFMRNQGISLPEIGATLGVSRQRVHALLNDHGEERSGLESGD